jgi:hypothetical protein
MTERQTIQRQKEKQYNDKKKKDKQYNDKKKNDRKTNNTMTERQRIQ